MSRRQRSISVNPGAQPLMDFDFSVMVSEINLALQEKEASLSKAEEIIVELQQRLSQSEESCKNLWDQKESIQVELEKSTMALERSLQQNNLLRENFFELQNHTCALEDSTMAKDNNLQQLERNLHHYQEESEALKRNKAATSFFIEQTKREKKSLSFEVQNSMQKSMSIQREAHKLSDALRKAHSQLNSLTKDHDRLEFSLKEFKQIAEKYKEENEHIRLEMSSLKLLVENKTFELIDAQRELVSLREIVSSNQAVDCGVVEKIAYMSHRNSRSSGRSSQSEKQVRKWSVQLSQYDSENGNRLVGKVVGSRSPKISVSDSLHSFESENENLLVMLHNTNDYDEARRSQSGDDKKSDNDIEEQTIEQVDNIFTLRSVCENEIKHENKNEPRISVTKSNIRSSNRDMLIVYLYLTAAAVKYQYSDVDMQIADLIQLGKDMPFWELYPYFIHVFESLQLKNDGVSINSVNRLAEERKSNKSKLGSWFSWIKSRKNRDSNGNKV